MSRPIVQFIAGDRVWIANWQALGPATVIETGVHFPESYPDRPTVLLRSRSLPDCWMFADECVHVETCDWTADSVQPGADSTLTTERQEVCYCVPRASAWDVTKDPTP